MKSILSYITKRVPARTWRSCALVAVVAASISAPASAIDDVLVAPAMPSELASERLLIDVAMAGSRIVAAGMRGHIVYSDDRGGSWQQASVPVSVLLNAIDFFDDKRGFAVGHSGVILTTADAGSTWQKVFDGNVANSSVIQQAQAYYEKLRQEVSELEAKRLSLSDEDALYELEEALDELTFEMEEAEFGVEDAESDAEVGASKPFLDVIALGADQAIAVGAYGFMFKTKDGGKTWENYGDRVDNIDRFHLNAINKLVSGEILAVGETGVIFRSVDDGETWESLYSPYEGSFFGVTGTGKAGTVLIHGLRGNLYRSVDAGDTWDEVDADTESSLMSGTSNGFGDVAIVGNSGIVITSSDGGETFKSSVRPDRLDLVSALFLQKNKMVVVGESGVALTSQDGQNL